MRDVLNTILSHRKDFACKLKYYLFEIMHPHTVLLIAERICPYCGRVFRRASGLKKHLLHSMCSYSFKQDWMETEEAYRRLEDCLRYWKRRYYSGIELLEQCIGEIQ